MKSVYLYRTDFKRMSDGYSEFDAILAALGVPEAEADATNEIQVVVDTFKLNP